MSTFAVPGGLLCILEATLASQSSLSGAEVHVSAETYGIRGC